MKKILIVIILILANYSMFAEDYVRVNIKIETNKGEVKDDLYIGSHPSATFGLDDSLGEKEMPTFPPPGDLHCVIYWIDSVDYDPQQEIHSKEVYYPVSEDEKYHYRYNLWVVKDNTYDTITVSWGPIPELIDSAYFTDIGEILFKTNMKEENSQKVDGTGIFVDYFIFDLYFSKGPNSVTEQIDNNSFIVYPNPVMDKLLLEDYYQEVKIYDLTGKLLSQVKNKNYIDVSSLNNGLYFITVYDGKHIKSNKFIKY